jgi:hypothetical protein
MVKLNFKKATPIKSSPSTKETPESSPASEDKSPPEEKKKVETTATPQPEELSVTDETVAEEFEMEEVEEAPKKAAAKPKDFKFREDVFDNGEEGFDRQSGGGFFKIFIIIFIVAFVLIISGILLYKFTGIFDNLPFSSQSKVESQKPVVEETPSPEIEEPQTGVPTTSPMLPVWQKNIGNNQFISSNFKKIVTQKSGFNRFSLIVITKNSINLTILSDSPDKVERFKADLNKSMPQLNFRTVSTQEKFINQSRLIFADLSSKIPPTMIQAGKGAPQKGSPSLNLKSDLTNLTQKHKLKLEYFKSGKTVPGSQYTEIYYYLNLRGGRNGTLNFLTELTANFPAVQINKIAVNPTNLVTYSDNSLFIRLNLSYMNQN